MYSYPLTKSNTGETPKPGAATQEQLWEKRPVHQEVHARGSDLSAPDLSGIGILPGAEEWEIDPCSSGGNPRERILALYDEFRPRLFRYMHSMNLKREQADEVIQETFMRLTTALLKDADIENVRGWIIRVAHNIAVDLLKKDHENVVSGERVAFVIENRVDTELSPEDAYVKKEKAIQIKMALSALKPKHRECFEMRAQGFRYRDIAVALGISEQRAALIVKQAAVRLAAICG